MSISNSQLRRNAGLRVRFNERGRRLHARCSGIDRLGTVLRETANETEWLIRWDGQERSYPFNKRLIEIAD